jgi:hypothetical protein
MDYYDDNDDEEEEEDSIIYVHAYVFTDEEPIIVEATLFEHEHQNVSILSYKCCIKLFRVFVLFSLLTTILFCVYSFPETNEKDGQTYDQIQQHNTSY